MEDNNSIELACKRLKANQGLGKKLENLVPRSDEDVSHIEQAIQGNTVLRKLSLAGKRIVSPPLGLHYFVKTSESLRVMHLLDFDSSEAANVLLHAASQKQSLIELTCKPVQPEMAEAFAKVVKVCPLQKLDVTFSEGFSTSMNEIVSSAFAECTQLKEIRFDSTSEDEYSRDVDRTTAAMLQKPESLRAMHEVTLCTTGPRKVTALAQFLNALPCNLYTLKCGRIGGSVQGQHDDEFSQFCWEQLLNTIKVSKSITFLRLCSSTILEHTGSMVKELLESDYCSLQGLYVWQLHVREQSVWRKVLEQIGQAQALQRLAIRFCKTIFGKDICHMQKNNKTLAILLLAGRENLPFMVGMHPTLEVLEIKWPARESQSSMQLQNVLDAFSMSQSLDCLVLQNVLMSNAYTTLISKFLSVKRSSGLKVLHIESRGVMITGHLKLVLQSLDQNHDLETLILETAGQYKEDAFQVLVDCIPKIASLKSLSLHFARTCGHLLPALLERVKENQTLTMLDLGDVYRANPSVTTAIKHHLTCTKYLGVLKQHSSSKSGTAALVPGILDSLFKCKVGASVSYHAMLGGELVLTPSTKNPSCAHDAAAVSETPKMMKHHVQRIQQQDQSLTKMLLPAQPVEKVSQSVQCKSSSSSSNSSTTSNMVVQQPPGGGV